MKCNLTLVTLTPEQVSRAKEANGKRKRITHAIICGPYGQIFGTEKQCRKYFDVWNPEYRFEVSPGKFKSMFPILFNKAVTTEDFEIVDYVSTPNLVGKLFEASDSAKRRSKVRAEHSAQPHSSVRKSISIKVAKQKGFLGRLFPR